MQEIIKPVVSEDLDFNNNIEACRWIVQNHQRLTIDTVLIDVQTANAIITVYDALSEENKEKALFIPIVKLANFCWKWWHKMDKLLEEFEERISIENCETV